MDEKIIIILNRLVKVVRELSHRSADLKEYEQSYRYESAASHLEEAVDVLQEENK